MATSNTGGAFGFLRRSIGSVTYRTSTAALDGKKKQVASMKPQSVKNPNTVAQIIQRMKVTPAQLFYSAFEQAASSVEDNPLSHSFAGYEYGSKNRLRFMQLAMQGEPKAYVPKGINFVVPGEYQVSEGNLQSLPWRTELNGEMAENTLLVTFDGTAMTAEGIARLSNYGVAVGDQLTALALIEKNERYEARFARIIVGVGNVSSNPGMQIDVTTLGHFNNGYVDGEEGQFAVAGLAIVVSRGVTNSAQRSREIMRVEDAFRGLLSVEAFNAAIQSYQQNIIYNSMNSAWYLNQGSSQAFNGTVFTQKLILPAASGVDAFTGDFILGRSLEGGNLVVSIFTSDGTNNGTAYVVDDIAPYTEAALTYARVAAVLGDVQVQPMKFEQKYYDQLRGI